VSAALLRQVKNRCIYRAQRHTHASEKIRNRAAEGASESTTVSVVEGNRHPQPKEIGVRGNGQRRSGVPHNPAAGGYCRKGPPESPSLIFPPTRTGSTVTIRRRNRNYRGDRNPPRRWLHGNCYWSSHKPERRSPSLSPRPQLAPSPHSHRTGAGVHKCLLPSSVFTPLLI